MVSNLFIKFYLDTSISRYIFIVKIFLEILLTFSPRPAALPVVQDDRGGGGYRPPVAGAGEPGKSRKTKKDSRYNLTR